MTWINSYRWKGALRGLRLAGLTLMGFAACLMLVAACGGDSRPGPLKYTLDHMFIARIPTSEQQPSLDARSEVDVARADQAKAQADYDEAGTQLAAAQNDLKKADLDKQSAQRQKKDAEKSADMNRVNTANLLLRSAEKKKKAAAARVAYLKARRDYLRRSINTAQDKVYVAEARYELAKAKLAKENNIRPKGFDIANFEKQYRDRMSYAERNQGKVNSAKARMDAKYKEWKAQEAQATEATGEIPEGQ